MEKKFRNPPTKDDQYFETIASDANSELCALLKHYYSNNLQGFLKSGWKFGNRIDFQDAKDPECTLDPVNARLVVSLATGFNKARKRLTEQYSIDLEYLINTMDGIGGAAVKQVTDRQDQQKDIDDLFAEFVNEKAGHLTEISELDTFAGNGKAQLPVAYGGKNSAFIVSEGELKNEMVYFDLLLDRESDLPASLYVKVIKELESKYGEFEFLCFIDKEVGPKGPIVIQDQISALLPDKKIIYYYQDWKNDTLFQAKSFPSPNDSICILYDLCISGRAIKRVQKDIKKAFGATSISTALTFIYPEFKPDETLNRILPIFFPTIEESGELKEQARATNGPQKSVVERLADQLGFGPGADTKYNFEQIEQFILNSTGNGGARPWRKKIYCPSLIVTNIKS